jgi:beta-aspartyl-peptidase (threonine type)
MRVGGILGLALALVGCVAGEPTQPVPSGGRPAWVLVIHGGAGTFPRDGPPDEIARHHGGLERALRLGAAVLESGGSSLDAVEQVVRDLEDDPAFNAGLGAVFHREGGHELDASIMDGATLACGAVAAVTTIKNPVSLARLVMERTPHVLLVAEGAERFAEAQGVERVPVEYFSTEPRRRELDAARAKAAGSSGGGTVGAVALDREGRLAAATSTGGLTGKLPGRVGDSPIVGAGTYANGTCAVSATGRGEEFIRHGVARSIAWLVERGGLSVQEAADRMIHETLRPGDGGVIVLGADGQVAMAFNTPGMCRGVTDAGGRFDVRIWE